MAPRIVGIDKSGAPIGHIVKLANGTLTPGLLACDGSAVSRTTFAQLFAQIGVAFGSGDGSTTFNVPDYRGRTPIGDGTGAGLTARTRGGTVGTETHQLSSTESGTTGHSHTGSGGSHTHPVQIAGGGNWGFGGNNWAVQWTVPTGSGNMNTLGGAGSVTVDPAGASSAAAAHNNMPPSLVCKFGIAYI